MNKMIPNGCDSHFSPFFPLMIMMTGLIFFENRFSECLLAILFLVVVLNFYPFELRLKAMYTYQFRKKESLIIVK